MGVITRESKPKEINLKKLKTFLKREIKKVANGKHDRLG